MNQGAAPSRSFLCIRHGVTDWNRQGRFQGLTDIPLNDEGIAQAQAAVRRLRDIRLDYVVSSPLIRAVKTAEIIAAASGKPVAIDAGLIECDFGSFEGRPISEVMDEHGITAVEALATILPDGRRAVAVSLQPFAAVRRPMARPSSAGHHPVRLPRRRDAVDVGSLVQELVQQPPWHAVQVRAGGRSLDAGGSMISSSSLRTQDP